MVAAVSFFVVISRYLTRKRFNRLSVPNSPLTHDTKSSFSYTDGSRDRDGWSRRLVSFFPFPYLNDGSPERSLAVIKVKRER